MTVQRSNGTRLRLEHAEVTSMPVTVLADEYQSIVRELRRARRWVWHPGRGLTKR